MQPACVLTVPPCAESLLYCFRSCASDLAIHMYVHMYLYKICCSRPWCCAEYFLIPFFADHPESSLPSTGEHHECRIPSQGAFPSLCFAHFPEPFSSYPPLSPNMLSCALPSSLWCFCLVGLKTFVLRKEAGSCACVSGTMTEGYCVSSKIPVEGRR